MPGLILRKGPSPGARFPIEERLILGRHSKADIVIQDMGASRRHAAIVSREGEYRVIDLGSRNGTFLNGKPVQGEMLLREGDRIQVGGEVFEFTLKDDGARDPATATAETIAMDRREGGGGAPGQGPRPDVASLPQPVGKFILLEHLGRGGMGDVYRARDRDGGPDLAIKLIRSDIGNRQSFLDYFHNREAVLAREIDHPNIIRIFEHGVTGDRHFIAMEYVGGESLQEKLRRGPIPFDEALEILRQLACGLSAAHRRGVVHSDIKPANVMVLKEARPPRGDSGDTPSEGSTPEGPRKVELEFPGSDPEGDGTPRYESSLRDEIRRRLGEPPQDFLLDPPFFPRPSEMRFLWHYWEGLRESGGYFLLVEGDPGTGKDRLLSEFIQELGFAGSLPGVFLPSPGKFHELDVSRIEGIPSLYGRLFPDRAPLERPGRDAVDEVLRALAVEPDPVLIRVLGLERGSPVAFELLEGLLRLLPRRPILILAALDSGEIPRNVSLREFLRSFAERIKDLYLRPLTEYQVGRFLQEIFREPLRQDQLAADLHRLTGGNLARLLETLRSFFQRGILRQDPLSGRVIYQPQQREFELEEGKHFFEKYRVYGKMERTVLEQAAFIGPEFLFETLLRFSELDETALFFIVRDLCHQGFIAEPSRTWYRFTNEAFRRYLADKVNAKERPRLHRKIAWLLDEAPQSASAEILRQRAYHWEGAGEHAKAVRLLLEGAYRARNEYNTDLAREIYQEVLRIYRSLAADEAVRKAVNEELSGWFRKEGNWYELLGSLCEKSVPVQVKITDFGISFKVQEEGEGLWVDQKIPLGTPRYLSPERVRREPGGPKADIFSLGIIAYEMLAGEPPFPGKKGNDVIRCNLTLEIRDPPVPETAREAGFLELFRGMVEKDQDLRWDAERVLRTIEKMQFSLRTGGG